jgi:hypothetical protein
MTIRLHAGNHTIEVITTSGSALLDFSGERVTLTGSIPMDEVAEEFIDRLDAAYIHRVDLLLKKEREKWNHQKVLP